MERIQAIYLGPPEENGDSPEGGDGRDYGHEDGDNHGNGQTSPENALRIFDRPTDPFAPGRHLAEAALASGRVLGVDRPVILAKDSDDGGDSEEQRGNGHTEGDPSKTLPSRRSPRRADEQPNGQPKPEEQEDLLAA